MRKCDTKILHNSKFGSWYRHCMKDANHKGDHTFDKGIKESILKYTDDKTGKIIQANTIANTEQFIGLQKAQDMQSTVKKLKEIALKEGFNPNTDILIRN